ncbi:hypothetical protein C8J57DRAFT_309324 [Mycena rebaudengoi]|nr:hypothetical protein C8J57DRAFT_309324 [Mycena rebaudengoi]
MPSTGQPLHRSSIVSWRVWVLYHNNLKVRLRPILCRPPVDATTHMTFGTLWLFGDEKFDPSGSHAHIMVLPLLVTNVVATSLMAYKMWQYRQQIKVQLDLPKNKKTKLERTLVVLTEWGMIYGLIWIHFLFTIFTNQNEDTTGYKIVANMIPQLSAIYPVIIVLLVSLDRTHLESTVIGISTNTDSDPIHFVGNTTGQARLRNAPHGRADPPGRHVAFERRRSRGGGEGGEGEGGRTLIRRVQSYFSLAAAPLW